MTYGYIRVSTDKQTVENQRFEINHFCKLNNIQIDEWIEETISGTKTPDKRKLGKLIGLVKEGDLIICSELSRLGRSLYMIMDILSHCMETGCKIWTIKDNFRLGDDIQSKVLAFAFGLSAEIEKNLISERTKTSLAKKKAEGVKLGRPVGSHNKHTKLDGKDECICELLRQGQSYSAIARIFHVDRTTLMRHVKSRALKPYPDSTEEYV